MDQIPESAWSEVTTLRVQGRDIDRITPWFRVLPARSPKLATSVVRTVDEEWVLYLELSMPETLFKARDVPLLGMIVDLEAAANTGMAGLGLAPRVQIPRLSDEARAEAKGSPSASVTPALARVLARPPSPAALLREALAQTGLPKPDPAFRTHFQDPRYLDVARETAPFGHDAGNDLVMQWASRRARLRTMTLRGLLDAEGGPEPLGTDGPMASEEAQIVQGAAFTLLWLTGTIDAEGRQAAVQAVRQLAHESDDDFLNQQVSDLMSLFRDESGQLERH